MTLSGSHNPSSHCTPSVCCSVLQRLPACTLGELGLGLTWNWLFLQLLSHAVQRVGRWCLGQGTVFEAWVLPCYCHCSAGISKN